VPYGTTKFGILNPVPSRGHSIGTTSPTQHDDGWLSDDGHGIITKYLPDGEAEFCLKGRILLVLETHVSNGEFNDESARMGV
jgi:hypothetical protein